MARAEEAMRVAHRLRPGEPDDFTVDKADALVAFWQQLTRILFTAIPAVVCIGIVVGGIVIMNIMLMTRERAHPRDRHSANRSGATPRATSAGSSWSKPIVLSTLGGIQGVLRRLGRWRPLVAHLHAAAGPDHPLVGRRGACARRRSRHRRSVSIPRTRAARLDPITALRAE